LDWAKKFDEPLKTILDAEGHPAFGNYGGAPFILFGYINGLYQISRNPMYLGMAAIILGAGLALGTWITLPVLTAFM
jgi:hypothetical protein